MKGAQEATRSPLPPLLALAAVAAFVVHRHWDVVPVVPAEAPISHGFSAGRAREVLVDVEACGVKYAGSKAAEVCAVSALRHHIDLAVVGSEVRVEVEEQSASGHFWLDFLGGLTSIYRNVTNVVVRLHGAPGDTNKGSPCALLVSAHFDSAIGSPAASDDGGQIAIMMELLRLYSQGKPLPIDLVFLFNGGEETLMQAAHGFTSSHRWSKDLCAAVNLEAAGSGGREVLFQVGPKNRWISEIYARQVPRPHGFSIAQVMFNTGVIPGDTDYRIYRDFGNLPGIDFAITTNGWVYHTARDDIKHMDFRSIQRYGMNVDALVRGMADLLVHGQPSGPSVDEAAVYFDIAGFVFVSYPAPWAQMLHITAGVAALSLAVVRHGRAGVVLALSLSLCTLVSALSGAAAGLLLALSPAALAGAGHPELTPLLFGAPAALGFLGTFRYFAGSSSEAQLSSASTIFAASCCIAVSASLSTVQASYLFFVWTVAPLAGEVCALVMPSSLRNLPVVAGFLLPWMLTIQVLVFTVDFLCPLTMRSGTTLPADVVVAVLYGVMVGFIMAFSSRFLPRLPRGTAAALCLCIFAGSCIAAGTFPYSNDRPKRIFVQNVARSTGAWDLTSGEVHTVDPSARLDSGMWMVAQDWNGLGTLQKHAPLGLPADAQPINQDGGVYGQLPLPFPLRPFIQKGIWVSGAGPPPRLDALRLGVALAESAGPSVVARPLVLSVSGGTHIMMALGPRSQVEAWSLGWHSQHDVGEEALTWSGSGRKLPEGLPPPRADCDCYWVLFTEGGLDPARGRGAAFNLTIAVRPGDLHVDVWAMHFESASPEVLEQKKRLPAWVDVQGWDSELQSHTIRV